MNYESPLVDVAEDDENEENENVADAKPDHQIMNVHQMFEVQEQQQEALLNELEEND